MTPLTGDRDVKDAAALDLPVAPVLAEGRRQRVEDANERRAVSMLSVPASRTSKADVGRAGVPDRDAPRRARNLPGGPAAPCKRSPSPREAQTYKRRSGIPLTLRVYADAGGVWVVTVSVRNAGASRRSVSDRNAGTESPTDAPAWPGRF